jgi:hypothetical protein
MATRTLRLSVMHAAQWYKRQDREPQEWDAIKTQVKRRDRWTCVYCGFKEFKFMQVNHIGAEDDHRLDNLETVCSPCHNVLHLGAAALKGVLIVIESDADQIAIVRENRHLVWLNTPWETIERHIVERFCRIGGKLYDQMESIDWANTILRSIKPLEFRGYLPDGYAVIFHEEGPWQQFF